MAKTKAEAPFTGSWRIVSMSAWDNEYLDEEVEAYIEFDERGNGSFQFGYVQGRIDYRTANRNGKPTVEFGVNELFGGMAHLISHPFKMNLVWWSVSIRCLRCS